MRYIIEKGERPLFKSLPLLENIYMDIQRGSSGYTNVSKSYIYGKIAEIQVLSSILKERKDAGIKNISDIFFQLIELPLFFGVEQVDEWENKKIWNNSEYISSLDLRIIYESHFNGLPPSLLYQAKDDNNKNVWFQWLSQTPLDKILQTLNFSMEKLLNWEANRVENHTLEENIKLISNHFNFNADIAKSWYLFSELSAHKSEVWQLFLNENNSFTDLINQWEIAFKLEKNFINSLFYSDSPLVVSRLFNDISILDKKSNAGIKEFSQKVKILRKINLPQMHTKLMDKEKLMKVYFNKYDSSKSLDINFWNHIKNKDTLIKIIPKIKSSRILIYGEHKSGKSDFLKSILSNTSRNAYMLNPLLMEGKIDNLYLPLLMVDALKNTDFIIDNADDIFDLSKYDEFFKMDSGCNQFWTVSDITKVNKKILHQFDFIVKMEEPELNQRISIAQSLFDNLDIAYKIAQRVKEIYKILKIHSICSLSNDWSWENIYSIITSFENVIDPKKSFIDLNKMNTDNNIIPLAGYPQLTDLTNKIISFYKNPSKYDSMGAKPMKGILLVGPPGCGKTHFVKNLGKTVNIPIFAPATSVLANNIEDINSMFVKLRDLSPCILFLDEIDTLITNPMQKFGMDLQKQKIVNAFFTNLDGIEDNEGILVIGTTHRYTNIDEAAVRPGRLNKIIHLNLPDADSREDIWIAHLKNKKHQFVDMKELIKLSQGFSCADIMEASNKAATFAVENNKKNIDMHDLGIACNEVFWGVEDPSITVSYKQIEKTAYHEAGHTILAWVHKMTVPRVTIRPRKNSLGATHFLTEDGKHTLNYINIEEKIQLLLGGICAEKIVYGSYDDGGTSDLYVCKKLIDQAFCESGLGKEGPIHLGEMNFWSNERKVRVEEEQFIFMQEQFEKTTALLLNNLSLLKEFAEFLIKEKEVSGNILNSFREKVSFNIMQKELIEIEKDMSIISNNMARG